jgi:hypothetical protein
MSETEQEVRTLFAAAADDIPPGIDLLRGVKARRTAHIVRVRAALSAAAVAVVAVVTLVTLTVVQAPSALAQLTSAVSRMTAGQSYHFSATTTHVAVQGNGTATTVRTDFSGAFDPARGAGEETTSAGAQTRFTGGYVYVNPGSAAGQDKLPGGKSWIRIPGLPPLWAPVTAGQQLRLGAGLLSVAETSPQNLFALLKSVSTVDKEGSVSGSGWTGTRYAFSVSIAFGPAGSGLPTGTATGTIDVDQQGRVRQLDADVAQPAIASAPAVRATVEMTFGDFGALVSVSAPPAGDTFTPGGAPTAPGPVQHSVHVSVTG